MGKWFVWDFKYGSKILQESNVYGPSLNTVLFCTTQSNTSNANKVFSTKKIDKVAE